MSESNNEEGQVSEQITAARPEGLWLAQRVRQIQSIPEQQSFRLRIPWKAVYVVVLLALVCGLAVGGLKLYQHMHTPSLVPAPIRSSVKFPVYYPDPSKLSAGYSLDTNSFKIADAGVVVFVVRQGDQQLVFSEEQKPDSGVIDKFLSNYIPLHSVMNTSKGKAQVGAFGSGQNLHSIVSLPLDNGPWLIITAPANINQDDLQQIIQTLKK